MNKSSIGEFVRLHWFSLGILLLVLFKHSLMAEQPFVARANFPQDDTLFLSTARYILEGNWLGAYDQNTLFRGPLYALWISFVHLLGIPLIHANDLLYLAACLVSVRALAPIAQRRSLLFPVFVFLYFSPHSYDYTSISHAFQMTIYSSLALLLFGAALGLSIRLLNRKGRRVAWSILLGCAFTFFWYAREEGIFAVPPLVLLLLYVFFALRARSSSRVAAIDSLLYLAMLPGLIFFGVNGGLKYMNEKYYGEAIVIEIKTPEYERAYNALLRVKPPEFKRYVHVTRETLNQLYQVSPRMRELKESLDRAGDRRAGDARILYSRELPAATFFYAFRDAVAAAGYYDRGLAAVLEFCDGLGSEIEAACEAGRLSCGNLVYSMVPLWQPEFTRDLPGSLWRQFSLIVRFPEFSADLEPRYSEGDRIFFYRAERLVHSPLRNTKNMEAFGGFPNAIRTFKLELLNDIGEFHQLIRIPLFWLSLILLAWFLISDLLKKKMQQLPLFGAAILGGIFGLVVIIAIVDVTSFHSLFRQRHGALALVPLFIVCLLVEGHRRWTERKKLR